MARGRVIGVGFYEDSRWLMTMPHDGCSSSYSVIGSKSSAFVYYISVSPG